MHRITIGIFGRVNSGKSTLMNLITQQETSIVDSTPGTTADVKTTVMEIHGLGPVKIFDTAGTDEGGILGQKKKSASLNALKRSDIVLLVVNKENPVCHGGYFSAEKEILALCGSRGKQVLVVYNRFRGSSGQTGQETHTIDPDNTCPAIEIELIDKTKYRELVEFIKTHANVRLTRTPLLPDLDRDKIVFLNIPMDEETPEGRFLRPQIMVEEYLVRRFIPTFTFRMDLKKARSIDGKTVGEERTRFDEFIAHLGRDNRLQLLVTDSQAMDVISQWTRGADFMITTFSIVMINYLSRGNLDLFVDGITTFKHLRPGDKVMIAEGCNHDRKAEDIGTVQIPKKIDELFGRGVIQIDHYFGRVFPPENELKKYSLVIHCGGCMLDEQHVASRIEDLVESGVSFTNYGVLLSFFQGEEVLKRVVKPFNLTC